MQSVCRRRLLHAASLCWNSELAFVGPARLPRLPASPARLQRPCFIQRTSKGLCALARGPHPWQCGKATDPAGWDLLLRARGHAMWARRRGGKMRDESVHSFPVAAMTHGHKCSSFAQLERLSSQVRCPAALSLSPCSGFHTGKARGPTRLGPVRRLRKEPISKVTQVG